MSNQPKGLRVFTCAHSFHNFVPDILAELAGLAGIRNHRIAGLNMIGGSRVIQHWDVPDRKNAAKKALRTGKVDVLTLSPIWLPDDGIENFAEFAVKHNPAIRITVQEFWLPNDKYDPAYPLKTREPVDHNAATVAKLVKEHRRYDRDISGLVKDLNRRLGRQTLFVVPVAQATIALRKLIIDGKAPGLRSQEELFADWWGHPRRALQALNAYCHYGVIYRRSPVGLPVPSVLGARNNPKWNPRLNRLLQELAWEAVKEHPLSGVP